MTDYKIDRNGLSGLARFFRLLPRFRLIAPLLTVLVLVGCGGGVGGTGGGGGGGGGGDGGGVGGTGVVSLGTVTTASPAAVIINGTSFQVTAETKVIIDSQSAQVADLQPGMVVEIDAYKYTVTQITEAEKIVYRNTATGPISTISPTCGSMVILGQTVEADAHTLPTLTRGLCDFSIGTIVEVSGFISDPVANSVLATFLRAKPPSERINVSGNIASVSLAQKRLVIGALTIDYASATFEPVGAIPQVGKFARAEGIASGSATMTATAVELFKTGLIGGGGTEAELTGFISNLSGLSFFINDQGIDASHAKISPTTMSLANGIKVEVHGKLNATHIVEAIEIEIELASPITIESTVETKNANELILLGTPILVTAATQFENQSGMQTSLRLSDISPNDQITVSCHRDANGNLVADKIVLKPPSGKFVVEGDVVNVQPETNTFSMVRELGVLVVIDPAHTEMKTGAEDPASAAEFLGQLKVGSRVKAEGVHGPGKTLDASFGTVELKNAND